MVYRYWIDKEDTKYQLLSGLEVLEEKLANSEGQLTFSLKLRGGQTKELSLVAVVN
jgi:hypothetical protein